jgi:hypothetical protein
MASALRDLARWCSFFTSICQGGLVDDKEAAATITALATAGGLLERSIRRDEQCLQMN